MFSLIAVPLGALLACQCPTGLSASAPAVELSLDVSHPTGVLVSAPTSDTSCVLDWGWEDRTFESAGPDGSGAWDSVLLGIPTETDVWVKAVCDGGAGAETTITTGSLPSVGSWVERVGDVPDVAAPYMLTVGVDYGGDSTMSLTNLEGQTVWWETLTQRLLTHPRFDPEAGVIYGVEEAAGLVVAHLTGETERWPIPEVHHDTVHLGDGRYLVSVKDVRTVDDISIAGDVISIFDTVSGTTEIVWDAFDELPIVENDGWDFVGSDGTVDWTHLNGLTQDPDTGKIYASLYFDHAIVQIDGDTYDTDWILGGASSDFDVDQDFGPQHSPVRVGDTMWMYDNGSDVSEGSRIVAFTIDEENWTATASFEWKPEADAFSPVLGSLDLADDSFVGAWGASGEIFVVDPGGELLGAYDIDGEAQAGLTTFVTF